MSEKEILEKCKLTKEELMEYYEKSKQVDKKTDHSRAYRTLMNATRRNILEYVGFEVKTTDQMVTDLEQDREQLKYHLSMLEQLNFIMKCSDGWKSTPRGIAFLLNARME